MAVRVRTTDTLPLDVDRPSLRRSAEARPLGSRGRSASVETGWRDMTDRHSIVETPQVLPMGIAVVGMGCRFPGGVDSPDAYWRLLREGIDAIREVPPTRWNNKTCDDGVATTPSSRHARHGGFLDDVEGFDAAFFGITPRETEDLDPQQRLLLEVAWESLEYGGIAPESLRGSETGVFVGMSSDDYAVSRWHDNSSSDIGTYTTLGMARSVAAGRIAHFLGLHGPVIQLDTSCSSSLVAVYQAFQSLVAGECNLALAGGVNLVLSPEVMRALGQLKVLAPDGKCKTFDAAADGYVRGEGCGIVVLKRMQDAVRDSDRILAILRSAAVNHDGASSSLTTPNGQAQQQLMRKSLRNAVIEGQEVTYVEAHGTGTKVGDPIELQALHAAYGAHRPPFRPLFVGAVKTNIGHLEAAAGIAGLMKVVLMLQHGEIPPNLHFTTPNPEVPWSDMQVQVPTRLEPWPNSDVRRLAAVSAFGISGTNAHVILEAAPTAKHIETPPADGAVAPSPQLLPLSGQSEHALREVTAKYAAHIDAHPELSLQDLCFTAAIGRTHLSKRIAILASSRDQLLASLNAYASGEQDYRIITDRTPQDAAAVNRLCFLFTGQGTQYAGMGRELYESQPVFRGAIERCARILRDKFDLELTDLLYGDACDAHLLNQTADAQPCLFSLQYAIAELWKSWGVSPGAVIGHSLGEYAAAQAAGVFDLEVGIELVATRGRLMGALPETGCMAVVMAGESRVNAAIASDGERVTIASINGPDNVVISGEHDAVHELLAKLTAEGVDAELLNTPNAGHSSLIDPILEPFGSFAEQFDYNRPRIEMISNVTGELATDELACGSYWVRHARSPVRFADGMQRLASLGCRRFIEIGPNPNLLTMGMGCLKGIRPQPRWLPSLAKVRSAWETMLDSLAQLYVAGSAIDWQGFYAPYVCSRVSLPTYAFQRQAYSVSRRQPSDSSPLPPPAEVAAKVEYLCAGLEDEAQVLTPRLDEIAIRFVIEAIETLGFKWHVESEISEQELWERIPEQHRPKVTRVLDRLVERGWLVRGECGYIIQRASPAESANTLAAALRRECSGPECDLLSRAGPALASIWQCHTEPLGILFPSGATDQALEFYSRARLLAGYNQLAAEALREAVAALPPHSPLRILEVGAGTGGLTTHLLQALPAESCEYVFTDLSPLFLNAARERFGEFAGLQSQILDISRAPLQQGLTPCSFDLVVAANVLHATPRIDDTLTNVQQLLKPGGWLLLLEGANPPLWGDAIFTLIDGWWSFEDRELRPDYPLMRPDAWCRSLAMAGFNDVACLNDAMLKDGSSNTLYLARSGAASASVRSRKRTQITPPIGMPPPQDPDTDKLSVRPDPTLRETLVDMFDERELTQLVRTLAGRVMRLNPDSIDSTQPLSELGLDSLMATELRAQLGQILQRELTLNSLQLRRSVDEIVKYVHDDYSRRDSQPAATDMALADFEVATPRAQVVSLQAEGTKTPLFFVPAGYGDLFAFQEIAHAMGMDQPVYGLQPASAKHVKTFRQMSVYRLISAYIEQIKHIQPHGPYLLSGYSAGGIIVVELARELLRQGNEVGLLVIFDPPSHVPFWLDWFYRLNYHISKATRLLNVVRRLRSKFIRRLFHTVLDEGLRTHSAVIREHRLLTYPGLITHFRSRLSQSSLVSMRPMGSFWRRIALEGTEVHWIPGTHYGMLRGAGASVVVDELRDCLQRADAQKGKQVSPRRDATP